MRPLRFTIHSNDGDERSVPGTVALLIRQIPSLTGEGLLPPRAILNLVLRTGSADAGALGVCRWEPIELTQEEWDELHATIDRGTDDLAYVAPPDWVLTPSDWHVWVMEYRHGVPAAEHRDLLTRYEAIEAERRAARERGDEARAVALYDAAFDAAGNLAGFLASALRRRSR